MTSPSNYIAPKWVDQLSPGDKVMTGYPSSPYISYRRMKEATVKKVVFQAKTQSRVAVVLEEFDSNSPIDIVWIRQRR